MKLFRHLIAAVCLFALALGARADELPPPPTDKAQIVFLKPMGAPWGSMEVGIFDLQDQGQTLLGTLPAKSKLVAEVAPGEHLFMAHMGITHFLKADVEAGKRYYVLARFIYGAGFQLRPIRNGGASDYSSSSPEFAAWLETTAVSETPQKRKDWYAKKQEKVSKHRATGWETWLRKTDAERAELTLNKEDAF